MNKLLISSFEVTHLEQDHLLVTLTMSWRWVSLQTSMMKAFRGEAVLKRMAVEALWDLCIQRKCSAGNSRQVT